MSQQANVMEPQMKLTAHGVDIDVIARDKAGGGIDWVIDIKTHGHGNGGKLNLPAGKNYELRFHLDDKTTLPDGLRFDASAPIFVREGGAGPCPTAISTSQVMVDSCDHNDLVMIDWNYGPAQELYYQLNFVDKKGLGKYPLDPVILNGGGGVQPMINA